MCAAVADVSIVDMIPGAAGEPDGHRPHKAANGTRAFRKTGEDGVPSGGRGRGKKPIFSDCGCLLSFLGSSKEKATIDSKGWRDAMRMPFSDGTEN